MPPCCHDDGDDDDDDDHDHDVPSVYKEMNKILYIFNHFSYSDIYTYMYRRYWYLIIYGQRG